MLPTVIVAVVGSLFLFAEIGGILFDGGVGGGVEALQLLNVRHGLCFAHSVRSSIPKGRQCRTTATMATTVLKAAATYSSTEDDTSHNDEYWEEIEDAFESVGDVKSESVMSGNDEPKTKIDGRGKAENVMTRYGDKDLRK